MNREKGRRGERRSNGGRKRQVESKGTDILLRGREERREEK